MIVRDGHENKLSSFNLFSSFGWHPPLCLRSGTIVRPDTDAHANQYRDIYANIHPNHHTLSHPYTHTNANAHANQHRDDNTDTHLNPHT